ncbi:GNAT family N-acetyltransferase [Amycolatopsis sp. EV170708-02-1]|uniref:GNAT family N-acetyltransferase n=1 Tax=Amycolatopsis sp. EV170708-02-1 TaxID=2919322 RepID=UPI001F0C10EA|nr:GNAT family N-acetyltransferase [Amycolatopsis sp. EV170708-02-1]UMP04969.1 GNAT family N-acetyltransferase [Amycolatopsis sp. EV170708-02-1]
MSDFSVRLLRSDEERAATDLFRRALHVKEMTDEEWSAIATSMQPDRGFGAFDPELIGTVRSFDSEVTVPGGGTTPLAAVSLVGVRADRIRRGVLTALMRAQFEDFAARGVPAAMLHASEGAIYGRFGYGNAVRAKSIEVDRRRARFRPEAPAGGEISVLDLESTIERWPSLFDALPRTRPGMIARSPNLWPGYEREVRRATTPVTTAVHQGPDGNDGFVTYTVERAHFGAPAQLKIHSFHYANPDAFAGVWRYLLSVDLVDSITAEKRPLDEPVELLFTDPRDAAVTKVQDEGWFRLVDVETMLGARTYQGEPVVIEVTDPFLEHNSGRYRLSEDGAIRTIEPADLELHADTLSMVYLGGWRPSDLAFAGRIRATGETALERADQLFATRVNPWCGTFF